jgi:hypothetical protein
MSEMISVTFRFGIAANSEVALNYTLLSSLSGIAFRFKVEAAVILQVDQQCAVISCSAALTLLHLLTYARARDIKAYTAVHFNIVFGIIFTGYCCLYRMLLLRCDVLRLPLPIPYHTYAIYCLVLNAE